MSIDQITIPPNTYPITLQFILQQGFIFPGERLRFAWRLWLPYNVHLLSADLELLQVVDANEEHLWNRIGLVWSPPTVRLEETDGVWPPVGWVAEDPHLSGSARSLLYSGLETKTIRLRVIGRDASGVQRRYFADDTVTVVLPPNALSASLTSPRRASWGAPYAIRGSLTNSSYAEMTAITSVTGGAFTDIPITVAAHSNLDQALAGPTVQNWQWNDHPTYHVRETQLTNTIVYGLTLTRVRDEFGNSYPDVSGLPLSVTALVDMSKIDAAHEVERDFWANAALTSCVLANGILAAFPLLTVAAAFAGGACSTALSLLAYDAALFSQIADDPPSPDQDYWTVIPLPNPIALPEKDELGELNRMLALSCRVAGLLLVGSATVGKILGARLAAADVAEGAQQKRFQQVADEIHRALEQLPLMVEPAIAAVKVHPGLAEDQVKTQLAEWSAKGVSAEDTKLLSQALGEEAARKLVKFLSDPDTAKQMRPLTDTIAGMAPVVAKAAGAGLQELMDLLAISGKGQSQ